MREQIIGALVKEQYDHAAPRYLREFFNSFTAVSTSSNSNAESAQWICFCAREIDWSSSKGGASASPKVEVPGIAGRFGTDDEPPIVPGVEGSSRPSGWWSMSIARPGEPGALRGTEGISDVEDLSGH